MAVASPEEGSQSAGHWHAPTPEAAASAVVDALRRLVAVCFQLVHFRSLITSYELRFAGRFQHI